MTTLLEEYAELVDLMERKPASARREKFDPSKHVWRTIRGHKVMINTKTGKPVNSPKWMDTDDPKGGGEDTGDGLWGKKLSKKQKAKLKEEQAKLDKVLGKGHGLKVEMDEDGNPVLTSSDVEDAMKKEGIDPSQGRAPAPGSPGAKKGDDLDDKYKKGDKDSSLFDTVANLVGLVDVFSSLALKMAKASAGVVEKAAKDLYSTLEEYISRDRG